MAEDWFADVQNHAPGADEAVVKKIVTYCGIALRNRDSSLVSFSDPKETDRVREKFLRKKLGLTDSDERLDEGLAAVRDEMKDDRTKNRVTAYYLLSDWFGKHDLFGGSASEPGVFSFASPSAPQTAAALSSPIPAPLVAEPTPTAEPAASEPPSPSPASASPTPRSSFGTAKHTRSERAALTDSADEPAEREAGGWPSWVIWLLVIIVLIGLYLLLRE